MTGIKQKNFINVLTMLGLMLENCIAQVVIGIELVKHFQYNKMFIKARGAGSRGFGICERRTKERT